MEIRRMTEEDRTFVMEIDRHATQTGYQNRVYTGTGYVLWEKGERIGILHYCLLWDTLPFLNLLFIKEAYRNKGFGSAAMRQWEDEMKAQGYRMTLVSTQADEWAQFLYRRLGYVDCGGLIFQGTPMDQPMELFLRKVL
ncbi:MAG: GNAT family N-acetyltransferase [Candidatus Merdivicinus sp.]